MNLTAGISPSTSPINGSLVAHYTMESSKQLAAGIITLVVRIFQVFTCGDNGMIDMSHVTAMSILEIEDLSYMDSTIARYRRRKRNDQDLCGYCLEAACASGEHKEDHRNLSKRKFVIVCYEKVVRIPLEGDEIFRVHGKRTLGAAKALMNTKSKEEHEVHLKLVLESLRKEKLYAKFSKCEGCNVKDFWLAAHSLRYLSENEIESPWILSLNFQDNSKEWNSGDDQLRLRWMIYLVVLADAAESVRDAIGFEYCLASSSGWTKSPVLWAEIGGSSLIGPELVQETTDKVVLVKEKPKAARDRQKSYVDFRRKPLEFEVGDRVLLKVTPWKGVVRFGKKGKLAPRYVGPFEILERIGLVAYRLRLPEELNSVHDTFHVSNLKKCLADANLHVPLDEIKIDKTFRGLRLPVENYGS
ncbi:hypothetical protein Tco_1476485 [Tanacetum coccineum]